MRKCTSCEIEQPPENFTRNKTTRDGLSLHCRQCKSIKAKAYYASNETVRTKALARGSERSFEIRQHVYQYLQDHPCIECGESEPACLDFDHLDPSQKDRPVSLMVARKCSVARIEREIAKCRVVCANCHRRRTARDQGWYRDLT